ncbi:related to nik-1 protein (Os-1p protein) [Fusarium torulosum]|uniref:histidine kinase n=1 Tax=Fusarium torulosum TaxID=33205 RepID=A0AAE8LXE7_9HYPO|nr:related to nik-1 protein (Os-1p protein) [Fusarium torulosum]
MPGTKLSETIREYETTRYDELLRATCRPIGEVETADLSMCPDMILTSLAQLATCRTRTERSLISLFDESKQYIVAEATPTTSLIPRPKTSGDDVFWLCGTHIARNDGVCDYTLRAIEDTLHEDGSDELPIVVVQDLVTDPRFSSSPYCQPGTFARFYAAVPIRSPRGINIGVLCVINSTPGADWHEEHSNVLRGLAQTVMDHLEGNRVKNMLKRNVQMSLGLRKFSDGRLLSSKKKSNTVEKSKRIKNAGLKDAAPPSENTSSLDSNQTGVYSQGLTSDTKSPCLSIPDIIHDEPTPTNPFIEAADVIKEALDIDDCAFFSSDSHDLHVVHSSETENGSNVSSGKSRNPSVYSSEGSKNDGPSAQSLLPCQTLGASAKNNSTGHGDLSQLLLSQILKQYPEGCIFDYMSDHVTKLNGVSDAQGQGPSAIRTLGDDTHSKAVTEFGGQNPDKTNDHIHDERDIFNVFPSARSIAFIPIWDPQTGAWSIGGFICSNTPRYEFDTDNEMPFLRAIGSLAASEALRLETLAANKAKSDVLGSISHELRSPLHGITLGMELLSDSGLGPTQQNLAHMIETCCRTLSETTEHLLDYSKVNKVARPQKLLNGSQGDSGPNTRAADPLTRSVHLDLLLEDVIESVYAGHNYQHLSIAQMFSHSKTRRHADTRAIRQLDSMQAAEELNPTGSNANQQQLQNKDLSVFLIYDPAYSWHFRTLPGAIIRMIMNLFGNSLKYTTKGLIKITMTQDQPEDDSKERTVTLVVEDTGRGISEEFLRNTIFKPFSQEDQLATGIGLGLSFVQRIVAQLGGSISITSQINFGTKVTVLLPMTLETVSPTQEPSADQPVETQSPCHGLRVQVVNSVEGVDAPSRQPCTSDHVMDTLCSDNLGLKLCSKEDSEQLAPDVIMTNPAVYDASKSIRSWRELPVLVVCPNALVVHKYESASTPSGHTNFHGFVSQPISPFKLQRAISRVMNLWGESQESPQDQQTPPSPSETLSSGHTKTPDTSVIGSPFGSANPAEDYFQVPQFLLVEDNPINLKILTCFMKKLKQPYETATNGEEAVAAYKENPGRFLYILMDISMPVMDGLEATRQIRAFERYHNIPASVVLAITGLGSESTREEATRSGVDFFITKPAKLKELEAILKSQGFAV